MGHDNKRRICECCGTKLDSLDDERLDAGYRLLKDLYHGGNVQHADDSTFYVDLRDVRIVLELGPRERWRVIEIWVESPHLNIHFDGSVFWQSGPEMAIRAVLDTKKTSCDFMYPKNP